MDTLIYGRMNRWKDGARSTDLLILNVQVESENSELKKHMNVEDLFEYLSLCPALISFTTYIFYGCILNIN